MRQADDGEIQRLDGFFCVQPGGKGIFILNVYLEVGDHTQNGQMGLFLQHRKAGAQNLDVAPELVDDQPLDARPLVRLKQLDRAVKLGEHTAAVDVARQQDRGIHELGKPHVDDVVRLQIDLGGASRALDDDDVHIVGETVVGGKDVRDERFLHLEISGSGHLSPDFAVHDDLTSHVAAGFEQDGIHPDIWFDARRLCLNDLRTAHFQPVAGDEAVQGHVLAFEGRDPVTVLRKNAAERGAEQTFARPAHRALYHDAFGFAHRNTSERMRKSCSFSGAVRTAVRYQLPSRPG